MAKCGKASDINNPFDNNNNFFCTRNILENRIDHRKFIIINADDLGTSQKINDKIFDLISAKAITSTTLIANGPFFEDASKRALCFPEISFGVHLNISAFEPLAKNEKLSVILDENGCFTERIHHINIDKNVLSAIYEEFCLQMKKVFSKGIKVSHIDSHEHVHNIPKIFFLIKLIQKKFNINKVRISRNIYELDDDVPRKLYIAKYIYNFLLRNVLKTKTTNGFTSFLTFYHRGKLNRLNYKTIEVMTHPGPEVYDEETSLLKSPWIDELPFDIKLISYNELG